MRSPDCSMTRSTSSKRMKERSGKAGVRGCGGPLRSDMAAVTDQAVCIRQWDWSETSQTVSLFGRETGVVRAIAKGSKREHSRFSGGLEVMTRGEMIVHIKAGDSLSL